MCKMYLQKQKPSQKNFISWHNPFNLFYNFRIIFLKVKVRLYSLKVPKREIFDRSDFRNFYTIKSLRVGDFGVKIKKILQNI